MPVGRTLPRRGIRPAPVSAVGAIVYEAEALAYFAAMTVQPDATRKGLINDLIAGLKADSLWATMDWLALHAAHDAQAGLVNARQPTKAFSAIAAPVFTVDRGYTGDGTASYLDAGESWQTSVNFVQDSAMIGVWCNQGDANQRPQIGVVAGNSLINPSPTVTAYRIHNATNTTANITGKAGNRTAVRNSSTSLRCFFAGSLVANATASTSTTPPTGNGCVLRGNTVYSADRIAASYTGAAMSDAQVAALHNRLSTYLTAIGAQ